LSKIGHTYAAALETYSLFCDQPKSFDIGDVLLGKDPLG
jgi:hypothetical protein